MTPPSGEVVIRPATQQLRAFLTGLPLAIVGLAVIAYLKYGLEEMFYALAYSCIPLGLLWLYMARSRLQMDHLRFVRRGMVLTRSFARSDAHEVVLAPYQANPGDQRVVLTLFVRNQAGRRILRLTSAVWHPADLEMLAHTIGPRPFVYTELLTPVRHEELHPGSTRVGERHPRRVRAWIAVATILTLGVVFYVLATSPNLV